jgi:hypothetical protein
MNKQTVHHITDTLTAAAICAELGVTPHSIRYARTTGAFPASWYANLRRMCDEVGIPCPLSAFNWKSVAKKTSNDDPDIQDPPKYSKRGAE